MISDRTFAMIKPDAIENKHLGEILCMIFKAGFSIIAMKMTRLSLEETKRFYKIHAEKPFFERLTHVISSGPVVALILEKENAVDDFRSLIGSTDPQKAAEGTVRQKFGLNVTQNSVHGSDSNENASIEWSFFFAEREIG
jgi:nucleoside-diphosphate kinase